MIAPNHHISNHRATTIAGAIFHRGKKKAEKISLSAPSLGAHTNQIGANNSVFQYLGQGRVVYQLSLVAQARSAVKPPSRPWWILR
jgi:hypothetical protein